MGTRAEGLESRVQYGTERFRVYGCRVLGLVLTRSQVFRKFGLKSALSQGRPESRALRPRMRSGNSPMHPAPWRLGTPQPPARG